MHIFFCVCSEPSVTVGLQTASQDFLLSSFVSGESDLTSRSWIFVMLEIGPNVYYSGNVKHLSDDAGIIAGTNNAEKQRPTRIISYHNICKFAVPPSSPLPVTRENVLQRIVADRDPQTNWSRDRGVFLMCRHKAPTAAAVIPLCPLRSQCIHIYKEKISLLLMSARHGLLRQIAYP